MERRPNRSHKLLIDLSHLFDLESNTDTVLAVVMHRLNQAMRAERSSIFLIDAMRQRLISYSALDIEKQEISVPLSSSIAGWVFENRRPAIVNHTYEDCRFYRGVDDITGFETRNMVCTPLLDASDSCLGTLQSLNKLDGRFTAQDLELLNLAGHLVSIALSNKKLYKKVKITSTARGKVIQKLTNRFKSPMAFLK